MALLQLSEGFVVILFVCGAASFPDGDDPTSEGVVEVRMTVDESGDVSLLSGEVQKWFRLHAELPVETLMDPALLVANTHILFNPKRGDIKVCQECSARLHITPASLIKSCSACGQHIHPVLSKEGIHRGLSSFSAVLHQFNQRLLKSFSDRLIMLCL